MIAFKDKREASVTVWLCLALTVLAVLILGLLEAARYEGLKSDAKEWSNLSLESLFAGYQPFLFDEYHMFFLDGSFGRKKLDIAAAEDELSLFLNDNLMIPDKSKGIHLYHLDLENVEITGYRLATDAKGKVFEMQAANSMRQEIGIHAAKKILNQIKSVNSKEQTTEKTDLYMEDAKNALDTLAQQKEQDVEKPTESVMENPINTVKEIKKRGILGVVVPSWKTVSKKKVTVDNCLMKRSISQGNYAQKENCGWYERILMQEFLKTYVGHALAPKENGALSYGIEYLICGKESDEKNLEKTVKKLILLREGINYIYLQTDGGKQAEALAAATVIAGASVNPAVIEVVKQGILAAWAYAESIYDVKSLLSGGKVPIVKNASVWKTQLSNLGAILSDVPAGESKGLSYEEYLNVLLYTKTVKQLAYRGMDLMEWHMQSEESFAKCRMDHMITGIKLKTEYHADTLFLGILQDDTIGGYPFMEQAEYVYEK